MRARRAADLAMSRRRDAQLMSRPRPPAARRLPHRPPRPRPFIAFTAAAISGRVALFEQINCSNTYDAFTFINFCQQLTNCAIVNMDPIYNFPHSELS